MIEEREILNHTHYGLRIYAHILREYYPDDIVLSLSGNECKPTKNPYNNNRQTLKLINKDYTFMYSDIEKTDFKGDPFDFASLYYKLSGNELLEKINEELNLKIGLKNQFYSNKKISKQTNSKETKVSVNIPKFSYFKAPVNNIFPKCTLNLVETYNIIKSENNKSVTRQLRTIKSKSEARKFKASKFDYATFSGTFSKRNDNALIKHSGLLTIDFDHISSTQEIKNRLLKDEYFETELLFVSPSGDGLKWIISIDITEATHQKFFNAISNYIKETYQLKVDKSGKDISRACFLPFDKNAYINPKYLI